MNNLIVKENFFKNLIRRHFILVVIILFSLILHLLFLIYNPGNVFNQPERYGEEISIYGSRDAALYAQMAWQIIEDGIYGYNSESSNAYVTPAQPFYLVLIFLISKATNIDHVLLANIGNMILSVSSVLLIYLICIELFANKKPAVFAALLYATYFTPLHYFRTLLTEIPAIFMFLLTILIFLYALKKSSKSIHFIFGLLYAITIMFRPSPAPLILIGAFIVIKKFGIKNGIKIGLLWILGASIVLLPWIIRNITVLGSIYVFSSHSGNPLLAGTIPFNMEEFSQIASNAKELGLSDKEYALQRIKEGFITDFPLWLSWFTVGKINWLFIRPDGWPLYVPQFEFLTKIVYFQHYFVLFMGTISAFTFRKNKKLLSIFALIIFYVLISIVFLTIPRFGFFIIPMFCIIAGYGGYGIMKKLKELYLKLSSVR